MRFVHLSMTKLPLAVTQPLPIGGSVFPADVVPHGPVAQLSAPALTLAELPQPQVQPAPFPQANFSSSSSPPTRRQPTQTHPPRWSPHGSGNRTPRRKKKSCRRFLATIVRKKRSKSALFRRCLTSCTGLYLFPNGPYTQCRLGFDTINFCCFQ